MNDNVIPLHGKKVLFSPDLRSSLETGVTPFTEKPAETVTTVEQIICTHIVSTVRRVAENLGRQFGQKIVKAVSNGE